MPTNGRGNSGSVTPGPREEPHPGVESRGALASPRHLAQHRLSGRSCLDGLASLCEPEVLPGSGRSGDCGRSEKFWSRGHQAQEKLGVHHELCVSIFSPILRDSIGVAVWGRKEGSLATPVYVYVCVLFKYTLY